MIEEEDQLVENIWKEVKAVPGNRVGWLCLLEILCSEVEKQESNLTFQSIQPSEQM
jgi:hypothetical protein